MGLLAKGEPIFHHLDVDMGLSHGYITDIYQDRYGFMWFSTLNGINRYDGYELRSYYPSSIGGKNNSIQKVREDNFGNLWVLTSQGTYIFDPKEEALKSCSSILRNLGITGELRNVDVSQSTLIWQSGDTLFSYDFNDKRISYIQSALPHKKFYLFGDRVVCLSNNEVYHFDFYRKSIHKLFVLDSTEAGEYPTDSRISPYEYDFKMDKHQRLWCFPHRPGKIWLFDWYSNKVQETDLTNIIGDKTFIRSLEVGEQGEIILATNDQGLYVIPIGGYPKKYQYTKEFDFGLTNNHLSSLCISEDGVLWIGTAKSGVCYTDLRDSMFEKRSLPIGEEISGFQEDHKGNLWVATDGDGLLKIGPEYLRHFTIANSSLPTNLITGIGIDNQGSLLITTYGEGVLKESNGNFFPIVTKSITDPKSHTLDRARTVFVDKKGRYWISTFSNGVVCVDSQGEETWFNTNNSCIPTNSLTSLWLSRDSNYVYAGTSLGVFSISTELMTLNSWGDTETQSILSSSHVTSMCCDENENLFVGTLSGIYIVNPKGQLLYHLSETDGMPHNSVKAMVMDSLGEIWISTFKGLGRIRKQDQRWLCIPYGKDDGIGTIKFSAFASYLTSHNLVLFGGNGEMLVVKPQDNQPMLYSHPVVMTRFSNKSVEGNVILDMNGEPQLYDKIELSHDVESFSMTFSTMDFLNNQRMNYSYRLKDGDPWIPLDNNALNFYNLPSGRYSLQVKANGFGNIEAGTGTFKLTIKPPFWKSPLAYVGYFMLFILIALLIGRGWQLKNKRKMAWKYKELELMKQHELDQWRMTVYTNISHDLRTPISLILSPLGVLLKSQSYPEIKEDLELIYRNACQLNDEVDQLLDLRRIECQQAKLSLTYGDFGQYLREIVSSFEKIILNKGLTVEVHIPQYKINFEFDDNKMGRVISNVLSNAIKYNTPHGKIEVSLEYIQENSEDKALIKVSDTGVGIAECNRTVIFERFYREEKNSLTNPGSGIGLHIAKQYVEMHGGDISVIPNKPQGSIFLISLPMHHQGSSESLEDDKDLAAYGEEFFNTGKPALMVVEDNEDFRKFLVKCLSIHYTVYEAANGSMAWELLRRKPVQLVVSDVMMPKWNGLELCEKMKNDVHFSHIPVILLSALQSGQHVKEGLHSGAFDYVSKPVDVEYLLLRIEGALAFVKGLRDKISQSFNPTEVNSLEMESIDKKFLTRTIDLIQDNISNLDYSVEQLSQDLAISRSGFYKKMLLLTGKTPVNYIRDYKMQKALNLLKSGTFSISEVAYKVGYVPKQFTRIFKEVYGSTPSDYLKRGNEATVEKNID